MMEWVIMEGFHHKKMSLRDKIHQEVIRLNASHNEEDKKLVQDVLMPMLEYIEEHDKLMKELTRVGSKHGI